MEGAAALMESGLEPLVLCPLVVCGAPQEELGGFVEILHIPEKERACVNSLIGAVQHYRQPLCESDQAFCLGHGVSIPIAPP